MALSLLYNTKKKTSIGNTTVGILNLDASISEDHSYTNDVSMFPIEDGSEITDHVRISPDRITLNGFITNHPVNSLAQNATQIFKAVKNVVTFKSFSRDDKQSNVEVARDFLLLVSGRKINGEKVQPQIVDVTTGLRVYTSMMMTSLSFPRDVSTGDSLRFTAEFVKIQIVDTETIELPARSESVKDIAGSTTDKSNQSTQTAKESQEDKRSKLKKGFDRLFG